MPRRRYTIHRGGKQFEDLATTCQLPPSADAYTHHRHYGYKRKDYYQGTDVHRTFANSQRALYLGKFEQSHRCSPTLLRLRPEHDLAVVEMGASHPGETSKELVEIAEPDYGIITNVGKAHLEGFGSFEGIIKTKGEMYDYLRTRKEATIFIHNDNPYLKKIAYGLHQIAYGSEDGLYINGHVTGNSPYLTFEWKTDNESKYHEVQTRLIGEYNFPNALAAVTIGHFLVWNRRK